MIGSDAISLLFKAKGDTSDAKQAFNELEGTVAGSTGAIAALSTAVPIAGAVIAAMATVVAAAAVGLYNLTKSAADYAGAVFDVQEKTGLAAATLSTLKFNAENAGSSLEAISGSAAKFAKQLGEANAGNEKAQATMKALGVTSTDLDTALKQAIKSIYEAEDGTEQLVLAQKAFGKSGGELIPVIKQLGGDLDAATKEAERLGIVMSDKDLAAADAFGDALGLLSAQAKVAAVAFTADLMPVLVKYFTMASEWYAQNKQEVREWGATIASVVGDFARGLVVAFNFIRDNATAVRASLAVLTLGISELFFQALQLLNLYKKIKGEATGEAQEGVGGSAPQLGSFTGGGKGGGGKGSSAKSDAERKATDEIRAQLDLQKMALDALEAAYKKTMARVREEFKKTGDDTAFINAANAANKELAQGLPAVLDALDALERKLLKDPTGSQLAVLAEQQRKRRQEIQTLGQEDVDKNNELIVESDRKAAEKRIEIARKLVDELKAINEERTEAYIDNEFETWEELIENEKDNWEAQNVLRGQAVVALTSILETEKTRRLAALEDEKSERKKAIAEQVKDEAERLKIFADLDELYKQKALLAEEEFQERLKKIRDLGTVSVTPDDTEEKGSPLFGLMDSLKELKDIALDTFSSFASGIGNMIQNWILLGETGPAAMRKLTASVLAGLAAQAAVKSLFYLAEGIAALFWNPAAAVGFFKASAIMGGIAVGAAVAGRAIAGDAFKQQTRTGASSSSSGQRSGSGGGTVFSSQEDQVIETSRNNPGGGILGRLKSEITLKIESTSAHIVQVVKDNINNNGQLRTVIQDAT